MLRLFVNGEYLQLAEGAELPLTYAVNELGDIASRQGVISASFNILDTPDNRRILRAPATDLLTRSYNSTLPAEVLLENQLIELGFVQITGYNRDNFELTFFGTNVQWFNKVKDLSLKDLDLSWLNHTLSTWNICQYNRENSTLCYPLLNIGSLERTTRFDDYPILDIELRPVVYFKTIVNQIFTDLGIAVIDSTVLDEYRVSNAGIVIGLENYISVSDTDAVPEYEQVLSPNSGTFSAFANNDDVQFTLLPALQSGIYDTQVAITYGQLDFTLLPPPSGSSATLYLEAYVNGNLVQQDELASITPAASSWSGPGRYVMNIPYNTYTISSQLEVRLRIIVDATTSGVVAACQYSRDSAHVVITRPETMAAGNVIDIAASMPDVSQADLLKYLATTFNILFDFNSVTNEVTLFSFSEVIGKVGVQARNISTLLDLEQGVEISFTDITRNYGKKTFLEYNNGYEGYFEVDNETILDTTDLYKAPFDGADCVDHPHHYLMATKTIEVPEQGQIIKELQNGFDSQVIRVADQETPAKVGDWVYWETDYVSTSGIPARGFGIVREKELGNSNRMNVRVFREPALRSPVGASTVNVEGNMWTLNKPYLGQEGLVVCYTERVVSPLKLPFTLVSTFYPTFNDGFTMDRYSGVFGPFSDEMPYTLGQGAYRLYADDPLIAWFEMKDRPDKYQGLDYTLAYGSEEQSTPIDNFWPPLIETINQNYVVTVYVRWDASHINSLDLFRTPVYLESSYKGLTGYYYIDKIEDYDADSPSYKTTLIKL